MEVAAAHGWDVYGTELSSWAADIARQSGAGQVFEGTLEQIPYTANSFDCITLWDVIEHVSSPLEFLTHTAILIKTGGVLALSTYLIDSLPVRMLGTHYPFFMEMHLIHFSQKTLRRMLAQCRYEIVEIIPHQRVIAVAYFVEKLYSLLPFGRRFCQPFLTQTQKWCQGRF